MLVMNGLSFSTLPCTHGFITFQSKVVLLKKILGKLYYSVYCDQHKRKFKGLATEKHTHVTGLKPGYVRNILVCFVL